jgi:TPR repeat protein
MRNETSGELMDLHLHDRVRRALLEDTTVPGMEEHLTSCSVCFRLAETLRGVDRLLETATVPEPPADLVERILARTADDSLDYLPTAPDLCSAKTEYRRAAEAGSAAAASRLARLHEALGERDDAEAWYRKASGAGDLDAVVHLAWLLQVRGHDAEAETWWRRAGEKGHAEAVRGLAYLLLEQDRREEAEQWLRRWLSASDAVAATLLAEILIEDGRCAEAEVRLRHAADTGYVPAIEILCQLLSEQGDSTEVEDLNARYLSGDGPEVRRLRVRNARGERTA